MNTDLRTWHKHLGYDLPAVDLQHLLIEYTQGKAVALIEYRREGSTKLNFTHPTCRAIANLGLASDIPFFTVIYRDDYSSFQIVPCNSVAGAWYQSEVSMTGDEYRNFLETLRKHPKATQQKKAHDRLAEMINRMCIDDDYYQRTRTAIMNQLTGEV